MNNKIIERLEEQKNFLENQIYEEIEYEIYCVLCEKIKTLQECIEIVKQVLTEENHEDGGNSES